MGLIFSNNSEGTLASPITAGDLTLTLNAGQGAQFPIVAAGSGDYFYCTLVDVSANREVIKVTQHTAGDVFQTIERAVDSIQEEAVPTAYAYTTNDRCNLTLPKIALEEFNTGSSATTFQIDTENGGPLLKNNAGVLEVRDATDSAYANMKMLGLELTDALVIAGTATGITNLTASGSLTSASLILAGTITGATTINAVNLVLTGTVTGVTNITASGTVQAEHLISTDDAAIADDLSVGGDLVVNGTIRGLSQWCALPIWNEPDGFGLFARDHATPAQGEVINVAYGTGSPPAASSVTEGALFIKYIA